VIFLFRELGRVAMGLVGGRKRTGADARKSSVGREGSEREVGQGKFETSDSRTLTAVGGTLG